MFARRSLPTFFSGLMDDRPALDQFVLLSILLHVLLIVLFGNTGESGTSRAQRLWGNLQVSMATPAERGAGPELEAGAANLRLTTGLSSAPAERKQAQRQDDSEAAPTPAQAVAASTASSIDAPALPTPPAAQAKPGEDHAADVPELIATEPAVPHSDFVVPKPRAGQAPAPSAIRLPEMAPLPAVEASSALRPAQDFASALPEAAPRAVLPPPMLEKTSPPAVNKAFAPPLPQPKLRELPYFPPLRTDRAVPSKTERDFAPPVKPQESPPIPAALPKVTPQDTRKEFLPALPEPVRRPLSTLEPAPIPQNIPAGSAREFAPPLPEAARQPAELPALEKIKAESLPRVPAQPVFEPLRSTPAAAPSAAPASSATGAPSAPATPSTPSSPAANDRTTTTTAVPPARDLGTANQPSLTNPANAAKDAAGATGRDGAATGDLTAPNGNAAAPRLNLDALRSRAREVGREGVKESAGPRALLPFPALPKEPPKKSIEQAFDKALKRPDCKDAYADMGLAAVVPLVRDAVSNEGCKW